MRLAVVVLLVLVTGCKRTKADECDDIARMGTAVVNDLGRRVGGPTHVDDDPAYPRKIAAFKQACLTWPDEVFACMRAGDGTSPTCIEAMSHVTGLVPTDVTTAPPGPPVVARATLGEVGHGGLPILLAADGTVVAAPAGAVAGFAADGEELWRVAIEHEHWLLRTSGVVLVADHATHALVALGTDGMERWRVTMPPGDDAYRRTTEGAIEIGNKVYVPIADGRVLRLDPPACTRPTQPACLAQAFALAGETLADVHLASLGNDIVLVASGAIRQISTTGKVLAEIGVRASYAGVAVAGTRVAAVMEHEVVLWDVARCGASRVGLDGPQPRGCLLARSPLAQLDTIPPTPQPDGSVLVSTYEGPARVAPDGTTQWASEIDAIGPLREVADAVVFVSRHEQTANIAALDPRTGKVKWRTPLANIAAEDVNLASDVVIEVAGPWLVASANGKASWIKLR